MNMDHGTEAAYSSELAEATVAEAQRDLVSAQFALSAVRSALKDAQRDLASAHRAMGGLLTHDMRRHYSGYVTRAQAKVRRLERAVDAADRAVEDRTDELRIAQQELAAWGG